MIAGGGKAGTSNGAGGVATGGDINRNGGMAVWRMALASPPERAAGQAARQVVDFGGGGGAGFSDIGRASAAVWVWGRGLFWRPLWCGRK